MNSPETGTTQLGDQPTLLSPATPAAPLPETRVADRIVSDPKARGSGDLPLEAVPSTKLLAGSPDQGERIGQDGRFEILGRLGRGGMGHVFRAFDSHLDRTVAVKFILQNHELPFEQLAVLLQREAKVTAKLSHENIVAIFDIDAHHGSPFLVMELLDGQSLDQLTLRAQLSPLRATRLMMQVATGLVHAHAQGIIHRDLKPSNVFVLRDGRAKILDFGISRFERPVMPTTVGLDIAPTIGGIGTPAYMAPEQWKAGPQDARTDIWAAGIMYFQLLTGRLPYSVAELLSLQEPGGGRAVTPSVRALVPTLPQEADRVVAIALTVDPAGRFESAREFLEALRAVEAALLGATATTVQGSTASKVERRPLTVLACRLQGTEQLDLDDVIDVDHHFYRTCANAIRRWGGCIGTPVGGRFHACFGHPSVRETDAQHAVRAALEVAATMRERQGASARVSFTIGIHSGLVGLPQVFGELGLPPAAVALAEGAGPGSGPRELGFPAMQGDVPNVAVRASELAPANTVVMTTETLTRTGGLFVTRAATDGTSAQVAVGGSSLELVEVVGEVELAQRFDHNLADRTAPLIGREKELATLLALWEEASDGRGQIVVVRGEPGIGKSRLTQTLRAALEDEPSHRWTCQCWPHFRNSALHPIVELLLRAVGITRDDEPIHKLHKLERSLTPLGFTLTEVVPVFAALLSIPLDDRYSPVQLSPEQHKAKTLEVLVSLLVRTSLVLPTLFVVEDAHWIDHSTLELLHSLVDLVPSCRLMIVVTCRAEMRTPWSPRRHLHELELDRLSSNSTALLVEQASGEHKLPSDVVARLVATTDGVPLFVEELTRMIVESWGKESGVRASRPPIPRTLQELLLERLDRLPPIGREVAQLGSVLGRDFSLAILRQVGSFDDMSLGEGLEILVAAGILRRQGDASEPRFVFKHALIQQAAYQSLVKNERQKHHACVARVLEASAAEQALIEPELLAHHHAEAGHPREALAYWEQAGQRATRRSALVEAIDHYGNALECLRSLPEGIERDRKELALLLALGSPLMSVHGYATPAVEKTYGRARELARVVGDQSEVFPAMQGLWQFYYVRGMLPTSKELGQQLLDIAHEAGSSTFLLLAHRSFASSAFLMGDFEACRVHTRAGLDLYDVRAHGGLAIRVGQDPGVAHGVYQAWTLWMLGRPDQAVYHVMDAVELARRLQHPLTIAYALCFAALIRNHRGDHDVARMLADEAMIITTEHNFALWTAWGTMQRGWSMAGSSDRLAGIELMQNGLDGWKNTGARVGFTFFPVTLAEMCLHAGRLDDTARLLEEAAPIVARNDEHFYEAELRRLRGELLLRRGSPETRRQEAAAEFEQALAIARGQNAKAWELRLVMSRLRNAEADQVEPAVAELRAVLAGFTEGHDTGDVRAASSLLAQYERAST